ncbi:DUF2280 domain-containing protein [Salipiger bermudensis]|uniref:DUF2280 domain-containing protein n=1 Tax=Salipiger bermudensis TaxID=344736 RepID=UPI001CD4DADF|nr:DUF2280 domain-containing protein [Salipiger bermudensis]MCA0961163.1 DUF2280 domain-containing protein [Salipiger bermudensis]
MAQQRLPEEVKTYIVQALACFDTPSVVSKSVKDEFGLNVARQKVESYDPTKRAGKNVSKKHRELFDATRAAFLEDTSEIAISHRAVRLRALQRMAEKAESQGNMVLASSLLEQAAKETGGSYTNRREVGGLGGGPVQHEVRTLSDFYGGKGE